MYNLPLLFVKRAKILVKNWRISILGILISGIVVYFFHRQVNYDELVLSLKTARYTYVVLSLVLLVIGLVTRAMRWYVLLGGALPIVRTFHIMNVAYLVNGILPFRIGEVARMYLAARHEPSVSPLKSASTIVTERLLDLMAVILMALFSLYAIPLPEQIRQIAVLLGPLAVVGFITLIVLAHYRGWMKHQLTRLEEQFTVLQNVNITHWILQFLDGLRPLSQWHMLLGAVGLTLLSWAVSIWAGYVLMFAFYEQASLATTLLYIASAAFAIAVPAVPGNIGTYEAAILFALDATGYAAYELGVVNAQALSFAVMVHALNLFVHASTGILGFIYEGITIQQLSQGVQQIQQVSQDAS